ncbi:hypothetical protein EON66_07175 [archaeon]|nr:MAG: hypothetical protein EON66_07175 [archaeon]
MRCSARLALLCHAPRHGVACTPIAAQSKRTIVGEEAAQLDARLKECEQTVEAIGSIKPATGSAFVKIFLGQVNVKVSSQKDKETLRDEYNKFKDITNLGMSW